MPTHPRRCSFHPRRCVRQWVMTDVNPFCPAPPNGPVLVGWGGEVRQSWLFSDDSCCVAGTAALGCPAPPCLLKSETLSVSSAAKSGFVCPMSAISPIPPLTPLTSCFKAVLVFPITRDDGDLGGVRPP